jgi:hypothetical protein
VSASVVPCRSTVAREVREADALRRSKGVGHRNVSARVGFSERAGRSAPRFRRAGNYPLGQPDSRRQYRLRHLRQRLSTESGTRGVQREHADLSLLRASGLLHGLDVDGPTLAKSRTWTRSAVASGDAGHFVSPRAVLTDAGLKSPTPTTCSCSSFRGFQSPAPRPFAYRIRSWEHSAWVQ